MKQESMTARICVFARAYHSLNNRVPIFNDYIARRLLTDEEYAQIERNMSEGIHFFNPSFTGNKEEGLRWIVDHQLSPVLLARAVFTEQALSETIKNGVKHYLIFASGYDSFAYRQPEWADKLQIYEIDQPATLKDKQRRLKEAGILAPSNVHYIGADLSEEGWQSLLMDDQSFRVDQPSFCSMLGLIYYLTEKDFEKLISCISQMLSSQSYLIFDYPDKSYYEHSKKHVALAQAASEKMLASYNEEDMENLLLAHGFMVKKHLKPEEMTKEYFKTYNEKEPLHLMKAPEAVNYCLAVKK